MDNNIGTLEQFLIWKEHSYKYRLNHTKTGYYAIVKELKIKNKSNGWKTILSDKILSNNHNTWVLIIPKY